MGVAAAIRGLLGQDIAQPAVIRKEPPALAVANVAHLVNGNNARQKSGTIGGGGSFLGVGFGGYGMLPGSTGIPVSPYSCLQVSAAWACVSRLSLDIGKLPRIVRRRLDSGGFRTDYKHHLNHLLRNPNDWQTPSQFWAYVESWLALRGNSYIVVVRDQNTGEPMQMLPVAPDMVTVQMSSKGYLWYQCASRMLGPDTVLRFHRDDVMHLRSAISLDGFTGLSPVAAGQDVFGLGIATQQHGAVNFRQGTEMTGVLEHPGKLSRESREFMSAALAAKHSGLQNAGKVLLLDEGMKFQPLSMTNVDAQLLESRQYSVVEICRMFGVPPYKVHDLSEAHYNNVEQGEISYKSDTLLPITNQMSEEMGRVLLYSDEQDEYVIDVDYNELLKADRATRVTTNANAIRNKMMTPNEARIDDGREPNVPGGDDFVVTLDTTTTAALPASAPPKLQGS